MQKPDPIRPTDDEARALARDLIAKATFASIAFTAPDTGAPSVARVGVGVDTDGAPLMLISSLAFHTQGLDANPACSLMFGEPPAKGDPLAFPRVMVEGTATPAEKTEARKAAWLATHPKAQMYIDFSDFRFVRLTPNRALLNGGFGKAFKLTPADLGL